ncbi:acyl-CoA thioesterase/BAAT N-terminal domain-containing protein [Actinocrinis puniceicyclus]|uniref:Acyl-CoA thioesterase/BAAT N-terminal domain-containing protein n=1 Tax=Actinocrinis puniceicyclus TaxID=977794 RepID=A0A8J7WJ07_9ACTN|nr:acyl-CoA thioesterase/bile acid-CoA:amino acid N-acyltransferase family protein [Actinocrinis puniceicyclus]MBS2963116.1 acyl-CoA thioesterase/BAAT N-terminal domain-containing protein [Actinocrinis puniceicyclus]
MAGGGPIVRVLVAGAVVVAAGLLGATHRHTWHPRLVIAAASTLADQPVHIEVTGVPPGRRVTLVSSAVDYRKAPWQAEATFDADASGVVDPGTQAPTSGTYRGVHPAGLLWSMNPVAGDPDTAALIPRFPQYAPSFVIGLAVYMDGRRVASAHLTREWMTPGATHRRLTLARDGVVGDLFLPPPGTAPHPAVLTFGGSEGGESMNFTAALLAGHGYPALSLGYFALPGLPAALSGIPMEYFAAAARVLAAQPGVSPGHVLAMGYSRGTEAALLLADLFPGLVHGAVLYAPSAVVHLGYPNGDAAWTLGGAPVAFDQIPVDQVSGPVLAIGGGDDGLWDSYGSSVRINAELTRLGNPYPHRALLFPGAGHGLGTFPYLPAGTSQLDPLTHELIFSGGTRPANEAAQLAGWSSILSLLASIN